MMRPVHLRMARAALNWTLREFAERAGVNKNTIARYEAGDAILTATLEKLEAVLKEKGVFFIDADDKLGPGIRIRNEGIGPPLPEPTGTKRGIAKRGTRRSSLKDIDR